MDSDVADGLIWSGRAALSSNQSIAPNRQSSGIKMDMELEEDATIVIEWYGSGIKIKFKISIDVGSWDTSSVPSMVKCMEEERKKSKLARLVFWPNIRMLS